MQYFLFVSYNFFEHILILCSKFTKDHNLQAGNAPSQQDFGPESFQNSPEHEESQNEVPAPPPPESPACVQDTRYCSDCVLMLKEQNLRLFWTQIIYCQTPGVFGTWMCGSAS